MNTEISQIINNLDGLKASVYLAGRLRARTPRGAAEFLEMGREDFDERVEAGLRIISLYQQTFPVEFAHTTRPPYSTERELEFYHLINEHKFPIDLRPLYQHANWVYLWIPITCVQKHDWI